MRRRPRTPARILIPHSAFRTRMPRGVISSVPVSETGGPGAIPDEAAILSEELGMQFAESADREQTPKPNWGVGVQECLGTGRTDSRPRPALPCSITALWLYEYFDQSDCAGAQPQLAGHQRAHASGGVLHDGHQCCHRPGNRPRRRDGVRVPFILHSALRTLHSALGTSAR